MNKMVKLLALNIFFYYKVKLVTCFAFKDLLMFYNNYFFEVIKEEY